MAKFKSGVDLLGAVQIVSNLSPDEQATTVIFRNLQTSVSGPSQASPLVQTVVASLSIPLQDNTKEVKVNQDVRGFVSLAGNARALLVLRANGQITTIDPQQAAKDGNYHQRVAGCVPAGESYVVTLILLTERGKAGAEDTALLSVDSLDVSFPDAAPRAAKG